MLKVDSKALALIRKNLALKYSAIPIEIKGNNLIVAIEKESFMALQDFKLATDKKIIFKKANSLDIEEAIKKYYLDCDISNDDYYQHLLNNILLNALKFNSSDIHIEPFEKNLKIRMRIDGKLKEIYNYSKEAHIKLITLIKLIAGLDISEKRLPQDGRIDKKIKETILDLRLSTIPTVHGEKVVIRILNREKFLKNKSEIGFSDIAIKKIKNIVNTNSGIVLVTGPTGSGKTTTLYSILNDFRFMDKNIVTIEDPVEYKIDGINQTQVNSKIGFTFSKGLRAILRQDPDIIMVGEIRDQETAQIAIRAASTGHLVISTMHTNNSVESINRLLDMGIPRYLISSTLVGIISQRLIRKVCKKCTMENKDGCIDCNYTGYKGRIAIYEILEIDKSIKKSIINEENIENIYNIAKLNNMITFEQSSLYLLEKNITDRNEIISSKVLFSRGDIDESI